MCEADMIHRELSNRHRMGADDVTSSIERLSSNAWCLKFKHLRHGPLPSNTIKIAIDDAVRAFR